LTMFETTLVQGNLLKKILEALKELITDANFECSGTGITLQSMDSAHVALVNLLLKSEGFDKFRCDKNVNLGVNMNTLSKMLKCVGSDDSITIKVQDGEDKVTFLVESKNQESFSVFDLKLVEIEGDQLIVPDTKYTAVVTMPSAKFKKICTDLTSMGDSCTIGVTKKEVTFSVKGEDISGSTTVKSNASVDKAEESTTIDCSKNIQLTFALKFLNTFCKAASLCPQVILNLIDDKPLMVEFKIPEVGHIRYYLAPKIDEENGNAESQPETTSVKKEKGASGSKTKVKKEEEAGIKEEDDMEE